MPKRIKTKTTVTVFTDSRYVVDGITLGWAEKWKSKNWQRTPNPDLWEELLAIIAKHQEVKFTCVKGHAGHLENERCDELADLALNGEDLLEDVGYEQKEELTQPEIETKVQNNSPKVKVEKEGDLCRKCGTKVIGKSPTKRKPHANQSYYFEYYQLCPNCKTMYMVEDAKREIENQGDIGFFQDL